MHLAQIQVIFTLIFSTIIKSCLIKQRTGRIKNIPDSLVWDTHQYKRHLYNSKNGFHCECGIVQENFERNYFFLVFSKTEPNNSEAVCAATLVASNLLVTSNKCFVYPNKTMYPYDTWKTAKGNINVVPTSDNYVVHIDNIYNTENPSVKYAVKEIILNPGYAIHPQGTNDFPEEDIALIVVEKNLFEEGHFSACVAKSHIKVDTSDVFYKYAFYSGAGGLDRDDPTNEVRTASVVTLRAKDCERQLHPGFESTDDIICVKFRYPPPLREGGSLTMVDANNRNFLVGVASKVGYYLKETNLKYAYFTNVLRLSKFIERHAKRLGSTWCAGPNIDLNIPLETGHIDAKLHPWEGVDYKPKARDESLDCVCGIKNTGISSNARIAGGQEATMLEFPWMVKLWIEIPNDFALCGASIINDRMILTAAHCVVPPIIAQPTEEDIVKPEQIYAYIGAHYLGEDDPYQEEVFVEQVIVHPDYFLGLEVGTFDSDIALLILEEPIDYFLTEKTQVQSGIRPICLPKHRTKIDLIGKHALNSGWGHTDINMEENSLVLKKITLPILPVEDCVKHVHGIVTDNVICAGFLNVTQSSLPGDSGGPLAIEHGDDKLWTEIGLVSFGAPDPQNFENGTTFWHELPVLYTNLQKFISFIDYHANLVDAKWCRTAKN